MHGPPFLSIDIIDTGLYYCYFDIEKLTIYVNIVFFTKGPGKK